MNRLIEDSLLFAGIGSKSRRVTLCVKCLGKRKNPILKKLYGIRDIFSRCDELELGQNWAGFLNGESLYLPNNELSIRTNRGVVPNRKAAEKLAKAVVNNGSEYFALAGIMDDSLKVESSIDESSVRVSYLRFEKYNPDNGKVLVKVHFGLYVKLKNSIEAVSESFFDYPKDVPSDGRFYSVMKTFLNHLDKYTYDYSHNFISHRNLSQEMLNRHLAYGIKVDYVSCGSVTFGEYWTLVRGWFSCMGKEIGDSLIENEFYSDRTLAVGIRDACENMLWESEFPYTSANVQNAIELLRSLPPRIENFNCRTSELFDSEVFSFTIRRRKNMEQELLAAIDRCLAKLNLLLEFCLAYEAKANVNEEWNSLIGDFNGREEFEEDFTPFLRYMICFMAKKIMADPILYTEHPLGNCANYAKRLVSA